MQVFLSVRITLRLLVFAFYICIYDVPDVEAFRIFFFDDGCPFCDIFSFFAFRAVVRGGRRR